MSLAFGKAMTGRNDVIRALARKRLLEHGAPPFVLKELQELSDELLDGLPEGTILACAESLVSLTAQGLTERQAFEAIEQHRSQFKLGGGLPKPLTADGYIGEACDFAIRAARLAFGQ